MTRENETTGRLRVWVCAGVLVKQIGRDTHINPRQRLTLARSENEAMGGFVRWASGEWPGQAMQSVAAFAVPDDYIAVAAREMEPANV